MVFLLRFVSACLLYQMGNIDRENRKHHHAQRCQNNRECLPGGGNGVNVGAYRRYVHESPP